MYVSFRSKLVLVIASTLLVCYAFTELSPVKSDIYSWNTSEEEKTPFGSVRNMLLGQSRDFYILHVKGISLNPGATGPSIDQGAEGLLLVKSGVLSVSMSTEGSELVKGSAVLLLPGESIRIENTSDHVVEYFMLEFISKAPMDLERSKEAGPSQIIDWNELDFTEHGKGGVRRYFDRPTAMSSRFEMHATTLNPGLKSHEPHTHRAAEIILMLEGETEEQIGHSFYKGEAGDFYFLESEVSHAIENIGKEPATYYAFQFE